MTRHCQVTLFIVSYLLSFCIIAIHISRINAQEAESCIQMHGLWSSFVCAAETGHLSIGCLVFPSFHFHQRHHHHHQDHHHLCFLLFHVQRWMDTLHGHIKESNYKSFCIYCITLLYRYSYYFLFIFTYPNHHHHRFIDFEDY